MKSKRRNWFGYVVVPEHVEMVGRAAYLVDRVWGSGDVPANPELTDLLGRLLQLLGEMLTIEAFEPNGMQERRRLRKKLKELEREAGIAVLLYS
jgi:hypothetical protein